MFIIVRFGMGEEFFVNPECCRVNFMNYIKDKMAEIDVTVDDEETLDLVNVKTGTPCNIHSCAPVERPPNLVDRDVYVPIVVTLGSSQEVANFNLILDSSIPMYEILNTKINSILHAASGEKEKHGKKKLTGQTPRNSLTNETAVKVSASKAKHGKSKSPKPSSSSKRKR